VAQPLVQDRTVENRLTFRISQVLPTKAAFRLLPRPDGPLALLEAGAPAASGSEVPSPAPTASTPPTVVFVPGYTGSKEDFAPLLEPLAATGYRAVSMDQRGQFQSPGATDPVAYTVPGLAQDVLAVAEDLGAPVHLVGHSFGGMVGRAAVIARPELFASLTLVGSGPSAIGGERRQRIDLLEPVLASGGTAAVYALLEKYAEYADPTWPGTPPPLKRFLKRRFLASCDLGMKAMGDALRSEPDRVAELAATAVPVLVAYGEQDDAWPPPVQQAMAARLGAPVVMIPDCGHSPGVENPQALLRELTDFWAGTAGTRGTRA
jgi:pimeloyl-ACP methyl ester carboxylesterase